MVHSFMEEDPRDAWLVSGRNMMSSAPLPGYDMFIQPIDATAAVTPTALARYGLTCIERGLYAEGAVFFALLSERLAPGQGPFLATLDALRSAIAGYLHAQDALLEAPSRPRCCRYPCPVRTVWRELSRATAAAFHRKTGWRSQAKSRPANRARHRPSKGSAGQAPGAGFPAAPPQRKAYCHAASRSWESGDRGRD